MLSYTKGFGFWGTTVVDWALDPTGAFRFPDHLYFTPPPLTWNPEYPLP